MAEFMHRHTYMEVQTMLYIYGNGIVDVVEVLNNKISLHDRASEFHLSLNFSLLPKFVANKLSF